MDTAPSLYMRDHRRVGRWCGRVHPKRATTDYRLKDTVCDRSHRTSVHLITSHTLTQATQCVSFAVLPSAAAPVSCCSVPQCHCAPHCRSCRTEEHQKPLFPGLCFAAACRPQTQLLRRAARRLAQSQPAWPSVHEPACACSIAQSPWRGAALFTHRSAHSTAVEHLGHPVLMGHPVNIGRNPTTLSGYLTAGDGQRQKLAGPPRSQPRLSVAGDSNGNLFSRAVIRTSSLLC